MSAIIPTMMKKLSDDRPLGLYCDPNGFFRSEYQVGRRLIWVRCQHRQDCLECVERSDALMPAICAAMPEVIEFAENYSRIMSPEFWARHDMAKRDGCRLDVWGITITPDFGMAKFDIAENHSFDYSSPTFAKDDYLNIEPFLLPRLPDRHHVFVVRDSRGVLSVEPQSN